MDYLFYCTTEKINLSHLGKFLLEQGLASSIVTTTPTKALVNFRESWFQIDELPPPYSDRFEEAQCAVLGELDIQSVFQLSFHISFIDDILPPVRAILATFGGWIGVDDGSFSARVDLVHADDIPAALHALLAPMEDE